MTERELPRPRVLDLLAVLFAAGVAAMYVTPHLLDADEAVFAAIGYRMRALGLPPYAGGWDHKPPGVFWVYEALGSAWSSHGLLFVHLASALAWVATALLAGLAARRIAGAAAFAPTVIAYTLLRSFGETKAGAANTEAFLSPFLAAGLVLTLLPNERVVRCALAGGVALGVAAVLKPPVAIYGPAIVAAAWIVHGGRRALVTGAAAAAGAVLVLAPVAIYLAATGTLSDGLRLNIEANRIYMEHGPRQSFGELVSGIVAEPARAAAPWIFAIDAARVAVRTPSQRRGAAAIALLLLAGLVAVSLGGLLFRHYWIMLHPVLAVAAGIGIARLVPRFPPRDVRGWCAFAVAAVVVAVFWFPAQWQDKRRLLRTHLFDDAAPLPYESQAFGETAAAMRRLSSPEETVFVWGANPELYLLAERVPSSRQISCGLLTGWHRPDVRMGKAPPDPDVFPGAWDALFDDLRAHPPAVVADTGGNGYRNWDRYPISLFPKLAAWLEAEYEPAGSAGGCAMFVRRGR